MTKQVPQKNVGVFCGQFDGKSPVYIDQTRALAKLLAAKQIGVYYGGSSLGIMGALADGMLEYGGFVSGVLPSFLLDREVAHKRVQELYLVQSMHERKSLIAHSVDAFITLPGGIGTLDEMFEIWTWCHLKLHNKPMAIFNINHYFDPLIKFLDHMVSEGFLPAPIREKLIVDDDPERLLNKLEQ